MYKSNTHTIKKSLKPLLTISAIATLLIAAMSIASTTNANAFNFGLKSEDDNNGSIDTDSLFSCVGAAIACLNTNQNNNNVPVETPTTPTPGTCDDFVDCFVKRLNPTQFDSVQEALGVPGTAPDTDICEKIAGMTEAEVRLAISASGVPIEFENSIIECLKDAGFVFATD